MKVYFRLQYLRFERWLQESGVHPFLGMILMAIAFIGGSEYAYYKTSYAPWILCLIAISYLFKIGAQERTEQLKAIFSRDLFIKIRLLENVLIIIPFLLLFALKGSWIPALSLIPIAPLLIFWNQGFRFNRTIPTPFKKFPFEFIIGFRKSFPIILLAWFLVYKSIDVDNFNLGLAALGLVFLNNMSFFLKPESPYFVWIFSTTPSQFLKRKAWVAMICNSILTVPILVALCIGYPENWWIPLLIQFVGYVFLVSVILAKYSAYPGEISIPQGILYALSLWFPPMLLLVIPLFYKQSIKNLKPILK
ncbi:MAG: hypothetical protein R2879_18500 [Saprospiraceae bacterium]